MSYKNFADYVASFDNFNNRTALTIRSFLKTQIIAYVELKRRSYQTANYLSSIGIGKGDRVLLLALNSPEWVELFLGCQLIGAILVPVDAGSNLQTTLRFIKETDPKVIFKNDFLHSELSKDFKTNSIEDLNHVINHQPDTKPNAHIDGSSTALIVFTSGTTAAPKGVVLSQKNILTNVTGIQQAINISADWRLLSVLPLSHMYELTGSLSVLSRGASIFYMPRVTPLAIARGLQDYQITTMLAIPQLLILLRQRIEQTAKEQGKDKALAFAAKLARPLPLPLRRLIFHSVHSKLGGHLGLVVTGGAPVPIEIATAWERMGVRVLQGYGLTETSPILTVNQLNQRRLDSAGRSLDNVSLRIAKDGEIQAKGPSIFEHYWRDSEATKQAFTKDGWFKTGDVGRLSSGWLTIQGRLKFAIVLSSGLKVFPEDIEVVAAKIPTFKEICVVNQKRADGETVLAVVVSDKSDSAVTQAISETNDQLESFQHITSWRRWPEDAFPRTRLLKIDRKQVQQWADHSNPNEKSGEADKPTAQDPIIGMINLSLGDNKNHIKDADRLADIGLDSLRRMTMVALIAEQLGVALPEDRINQTTTVGDVRRLVKQAKPIEQPEPPPKWPLTQPIRLIGNGLRETIISGLVRIWVKTNVEGLDNLSKVSLPAIFIFNHADDFDGPVVYRSLPHRIRKHLTVAVADDVLKEHKVLAVIARLCFAGFNFARKEPYMPSLEYVGQLISRGWFVLISPEGRISTTGKLQPFKSGIGLLAVSLGVPIVPIKTIGLAGTVPLHSKWPKKRSQVVVRIGEPITLESTMNFDDATERIQHIMEDL